MKRNPADERLEDVILVRQLHSNLPPVVRARGQHNTARIPQRARSHLSGLNYHHVTEFAKQRTGVNNEPPEDKVRNDLKAVKEARPRISRSKRRKLINGEPVAHYQHSLRNETEPFPSTQDLTDGGTELPRARYALRSNNCPPVGTPNAARRDFATYTTRESERLGHHEASRASPITHQGPSSDDTKFFGGVKYERKIGGVWGDKLVSPGTIMTIDGEDYVEYRVLTKPQ